MPLAAIRPSGCDRPRSRRSPPVPRVGRARRPDRARRCGVPASVADRRCSGSSALQAVIVNKAMSLAVVVTALPVRLRRDHLRRRWPRTGWSWSTSSPAASSAPGSAPRGPPACAPPPCYKVLAGPARADGRRAGLHPPRRAQPRTQPRPDRRRPSPGWWPRSAIGVVAAVMGVAGGELLIPTIVLLLRRRHQDRRQPLPGCVPARPCWWRSPATAATRRFTVLRGNGRFLLAMTAGSVVSAASSARCSWASFPHSVLIP